MRRNSTTAFGTAILWLASMAVPALAQVSFQRFPVQNGFINDMSADGSVVVGMWVAPPTKTSQAWRWTASGGVQDLGGDMDSVYISRDGKTIVGSARDASGNRQAAIWQSGTTWQLLGGIAGAQPGSDRIISSSKGVSADGSVIVGSSIFSSNSTQHAFRWTAQTGMVDLGGVSSKKSDSSSAVSVSGDGNTVVGFDQGLLDLNHQTNLGRAGVIFWNGLERAMHPFGWAGEARYTNNVGSVIVGQSHPLGGGWLPNDTFVGYYGTYLYTAWDGRYQDLGAVLYSELSPSDALREYSSTPNGVSDDGGVVVGKTGVNLASAYVWTPATGLLRVSEYLSNNGVKDHLGWQLTFSTYVSPDGKRIAGIGFDPQLTAYSWIVSLR